MKESAGNYNFAKQQMESLDIGCSFKKKLQVEQNRSLLNDERIKFLQAQIEKMKQQNKLKQKKLKSIQQLINQEEKKKQRQPCFQIIQQLREHFKALRYELLDMLQDQQSEDDVDVDNMTYEELLQLGQKIGKVSKGVHQTKIQQLKKIQFTKKQSKDHQCTICRDQFNQEDECIKLSCEHLFHVQCLKQWLKIEKVCPNCKTEIS